MSYIMALKINEKTEIQDSGVNLESILAHYKNVNTYWCRINDINAVPDLYKFAFYYYDAGTYNIPNDFASYGILIHIPTAFNKQILIGNWPNSSGNNMLVRTRVGSDVGGNGEWDVWRDVCEQKKAYAFHKCGAFTINGTYPSAGFDLSISTKGQPVFLSFSGDMNNITTSTGCWVRISLFRNGTKLTQIIAEATGSSQNVPFNLTYLDCVGAGTYTYTALVERGGNDSNFGEEGNHQAPQFIIYEI